MFKYKTITFFSLPTPKALELESCDGWKLMNILPDDGTFVAYFMTEETEIYYNVGNVAGASSSSGNSMPTIGSLARNDLKIFAEERLQVTSWGRDKLEDEDIF